MVLIFGLVGCGSSVDDSAPASIPQAETAPDNTGEKPTASNPEATSSASNSIDFADAESFEYALNCGAALECPLIVRLQVNSYHTDSALGFNAWAGKHLNCISSTDLKLESGQVITMRVKDISSVLGSWAIAYELVNDAEITDSTFSADDLSKIEEKYQLLYYFKDGVYVGKEAKVVITEIDVALPGSQFNTLNDCPILRLKYDLTNLSTSNELDSFAWTSYFNAIQDNDPNIVNELESASQEDTTYQTNWDAKIKPGGTVSGIHTYALTDLTTPVQLIAHVSRDNKVGELLISVEDLVNGNGTSKTEQVASNAQPNSDNSQETNDAPPASTTPDTSSSQPAKEPAPKPEESKPAETPATPSTSSGIRPEFKECIDSYEKFFDDYVDFMKSYSAKPSDLTLLAKYPKFLADYADTMKKLEELDEGEMSPEELEYYTAAMLRINTKLASVAS